MKKMIAVLLAVLIIGTAPAFAIPHGETADTMAVKGKGADVASASELVEAVESRQATGAENETLTANVSSTNTTMSDDPVPAEATGADAQLLDEGLDSVVSENDTTGAENVTATIPQIDTTGIVMQSTDFSCGPAALATVLQNMGINATEGELKVLAGTDTSGTSMHGLSEAAKAKGLSATGMKLSVDDLKPNNIVHIILDGEGHYSVIREITESSVKLADPSLGNIEMTREKFAEVYTGNVLVISDPNMQVNQTAEQANNTTSTVQSENQSLTNEEMQTIRGRVIPKILAGIVVAMKVAVIKAVRALSLRQLGTMSRGALEQHMKRFLGWLPKLSPYGGPAIGAARGIDNYRRSTPAHKRTYYGYVHAAFRGGLLDLLPW